MMPTPSQDELLSRFLSQHLRELDPAALALLNERLEWMECPAGATLMSQGDPGDAMYLSVSGRLRAYVRDEDGVEHLVREMSRGQIIGEMSLFTDAPRSATVVAIRDSVLVKLDKSEFTRLLATSPSVSIALTRQLIERLFSAQARSDLAAPVVIGVMPITAGAGALAFAHRLARHLERVGKACVVDADHIDAALHMPGLARCDTEDLDANRRIALYLDDLEARHSFVLLVADESASAWTERCSRHGDELLLLADAAAAPALHESERQFLMQRPGRTEAAEVLVLLHPQGQTTPRGTQAWLARRSIADHVHIRPMLDRDMARLARIQSRTAVGLVLAGGGARGCAHLGIYRALQDHGIDVDFVGGTSIGAVMAALIASDRPPDEVTAIARRAFGVNPTGDFNVVPILSLIAGKRLRRVVENAVDELMGFGGDVEDLWKNTYCIASNYSQASEVVVRHGLLSKAVRASIAIPGALPPVLHDGDLLCDGGTFNNFPVDVMRRVRGIGQVIGVDLSFRQARRIEQDEVPGTWALLRDRLRRRKQRRYRFPSLMSYLMNVTILYSTSRQRSARKLTDLCFNPPLARVGMLQWEKFDQIVQQGHEYGMSLLDSLPAPALAALRVQAD